MKRKIIVKESKEERKVRRERYKIKRIFSNDGKYFKSLLQLLFKKQKGKHLNLLFQKKQKNQEANINIDLIEEENMQE